jgi:hypothetical protein
MLSRSSHTSSDEPYVRRGSRHSPFLIILDRVLLTKNMRKAHLWWVPGGISGERSYFGIRNNLGKYSKRTSFARKLSVLNLAPFLIFRGLGLTERHKDLTVDFSSHTDWCPLFWNEGINVFGKESGKDEGRMYLIVSVTAKTLWDTWEACGT